MNGDAKVLKDRLFIPMIITIAAGLVLAATAWNFSAVASMPSDYVGKEEHRIVHDKLEKKLDKMLDKMEQIYREMPKK